MIQKLGNKVFGGKDTDLDSFLHTKHSNLEVIDHTFQNTLKVWKGRRKETGNKVYIIQVIDSGVCFFSRREGIECLKSFLYGVCCSFRSVEGLIYGMTNDEEEVH